MQLEVLCVSQFTLYGYLKVSIYYFSWDLRMPEMETKPCYTKPASETMKRIVEKSETPFQGNTLDFHVAMAPEKAKPFYEDFLAKLGKAYDPARIQVRIPHSATVAPSNLCWVNHRIMSTLQDGRFGAMMQVDISNDGPVTILLDSKKRGE